MSRSTQRLWNQTRIDAPDHDRDRQDHRDEQNFRSQEIVHWSSLSSTLLPSKCRPTAAESQIAAFTISTVMDTFVATSPRLMNTATSGPMTPTVKLEPAAAFSALALSLIFSSRAFDTSNPFVAPLLEQATTPPWSLSSASPPRRRGSCTSATPAPRS